MFRLIFFIIMNIEEKDILSLIFATINEYLCSYCDSIYTIDLKCSSYS